MFILTYKLPLLNHKHDYKGIIFTNYQTSVFYYYLQNIMKFNSRNYNTHTTAKKCKKIKEEKKWKL